MGLQSQDLPLARRETPRDHALRSPEGIGKDMGSPSSSPSPSPRIYGRTIPYLKNAALWERARDNNPTCVEVSDLPRTLICETPPILPSQRKLELDPFCLL
jgi:hypothetical protein